MYYLTVPVLPLDERQGKFIKEGKIGEKGKN
jgi:hypothetical protein